MSFFRKKWVVATLAVFAFMFIAVEFWAVAVLPLYATFVGIELVFLMIAMGGTVLLLSFTLIRWLRKYVLYFKLQRQLAARAAAGGPLVMSGPDGAHYALTLGLAHHTIVLTYPDSNVEVVFAIGDGYITSETRTTTTTISTNAEYFGEREEVKTQVRGFDAHKVLKQLTSALDDSAS